ncbi:Protein OS-9 [Tilletia horrida]|uniref:Protein OS-9 homolog n=1 Tax=Tilletia horrida TaxID=155126 RepID=A0AAN6GT00_9BASI|nr:Protein OS-9 [Tilletia horrida]
MTKRRRTSCAHTRTPLLLSALLLGLSTAPAAQGVKVIRPAQTSDQRFPPDAFAHPAYRVEWLDSEPLRNATAHKLLFESDEAAYEVNDIAPHHVHRGSTQGSGAHGDSFPQFFDAHGKPISRPFSQRSHSIELHFLDPDSPYVCAIPRINSTADKYRVTPESYPSSTTEVLQQALALLEPLKLPAAKSQSGSKNSNPSGFQSHCLYHTIDWFTYAFCHGRTITQFHALPQTVGTVADLAAALADSAQDGSGTKQVVKRIEPRKDPEWPAFVLGRWSPDIDRLLDDEASVLLAPPSKSSEGWAQKDLISQHSTDGRRTSNSQGGDGLRTIPISSADPARVHIHTALIEVVAFDDPAVRHVAAEKDKDGARFLRAAQAAAKASSAAAAASGPSDSSAPDHDLVAGSKSRPEQSTADSKRPPAIAQRYISQTWSDGTPCVDTGDPREIEVQFHCVPSASSHPVDRISMVRETTVCKYVLVIETSRLCSIPALAIGRRSATPGGAGDDAYTIDCRPVVRDDWDADAALRVLEEQRQRQQEEDFLQLTKRIQAQGGLKLTGTKEGTLSSTDGAATQKEGTSADTEKRKLAEDKIAQALSDALAEYFNLDPAGVKEVLGSTGEGVSAERGARAGSQEEYFEADADRDEPTKKDRRMDKLSEIIEQAMGELGGAGDVPIKLVELQVGEDGVVRTASVTTPTAAARKEVTKTSAEPTATETADIDSDIEDAEIVDALFDELGINDWLNSNLGTGGSDSAASQYDGAKTAERSDEAAASDEERRESSSSSPRAKVHHHDEL